MAYLSFRAITKRFGEVVALDGVSLDVESGEFLTLVGASGCGKTTLLRIVAGFTSPDSGELTVDGRRIDGQPPGRRGIGFVFQSYALFPTQTVAQNIGFSLAVRRRPKAEIAQRVRELAVLTHLEGLEARYPHELSGGQQQRVALARALAPEPAMLLLDEPLSALDAKIRAHLRAEIRAIVERLGITTLYVTHDQEEALSISDRVAVMAEGRILQVGAPMEVYLRPATCFVAEFIGTSNNLPGRADDRGQIEIEGHTVEAHIPESVGGGDACLVCVRPEHISLAHGDGETNGRIVDSAFLGQMVRARVATKAGTELVVDLSAADWVANELAPGDEVAWGIRPGAAMVFPGEAE